MTPAAFRIVLFVSVAHALMHVYELALPSVEQLIGGEFGVDKWTMGQLAFWFRLPIGACAIAVGMLTDRCGAKSMLLAYFFGCAMCCVAISLVPDFRALLVVMVLLGIFDSIYHPTGLAYLSQQIPVESRTYALGIHGVFGSLGIAMSPFLASALLASGLSWRGYYELLAIPGFMLGVAAIFHSKRRRSATLERVTESTTRDDVAGPPQSSTAELSADGDNDEQRRASPSRRNDPQQSWWLGYLTVIVISSLLGFIYAAFLSFLPRYLDTGELVLHTYKVPAASMRNLLAGAVLSMGMLGQYFSGRIARPHRLEPHLALVLFAQAPLLVAMAFAEGRDRIYVAALFALVHFMAQPVHNSLIALYTNPRYRSTCYGFSFMMGFGVGSSGAMFSGASGGMISTIAYYFVLAVLALLASLLAMGLFVATRRQQASAS